ncbi:MAG: amidase, partial [Acidimicrobiia bacterium]|nr:amidase [Acidimicrobiia bacterium]
SMPLFETALRYDPAGPFGGVPFLIKDDGPTAEGVPFTVGSRHFQGAIAPFDHGIMEQFRTAGLAALGVTAVPEMGISFTTESVLNGITRNPWDLARGVGGSSGGAAALVAAGAVPVAHGSDGAGSIRVPASCCGVVGLKPTRGRTPVGPYVAEFEGGLGCQFLLTRSLRDAAHLLDAVHGAALGDKYVVQAPAGHYASDLGTAPGRLRVALTTAAWSGVAVDPECVLAAEATARVLEGLGHDVRQAGPRVDAEQIVGAYVPSAATGVGVVIGLSPRPVGPDTLEAVSLRCLAEAQQLTGLDVARASGAFNAVMRATAKFFTTWDVLVTPTLGQLPAPHGTLDYNYAGHSVESWIRAIMSYGPFTALFNIGGQPAISLPLAQSKNGLPIGVQLVAPYGREDLLFRVAATLEEAMPWRDRRPPIFAGSALGVAGVVGPTRAPPRNTGAED